MIDNYAIRLDKKIEEGGFGKVYISQKVSGDDSTIYACKAVQKEHVLKLFPKKTPKECEEIMRREIDLNRAFSEQGKVYEQTGENYIVRFYDFFEGKSNYYFIFEYCDSGDLVDYYINNHSTLTATEILRILFQIALGLKQMHDSQVLHRDIKMENILLKKDKNGVVNVRICDLGWAKHVGDTTGLSETQKKVLSPNTGTAYYASPEQL